MVVVVRAGLHNPARYVDNTTAALGELMGRAARGAGRARTTRCCASCGGCTPSSAATWRCCLGPPSCCRLPAGARPCNRAPNSRRARPGCATWTSSPPAYLDDRYKAADKRQTGEPYARNRDFVGACEEALVSFAFKQAGVKLDYISLEILRRRTRVLGVANFSYYVPGPPTLRLWATA